MILVSFAFSQENVIEEIEAIGHSGFAQLGEDVVCAAATVLLRTFVGAVENEEGLQWVAPEPEVGSLRMRVVAVEASKRELYRGFCWFLLQGLEDLQREYPSNVKLEYRITSGRLFHGT